MRRVFGWLSDFIWRSDDTYGDESDNDEPNIDDEIDKEETVETDLIDAKEHPIDLLKNFDPTTHEGWNLMIRTLTERGCLSYQWMDPKPYRHLTVDRIIPADGLLKITGIKRRLEHSSVTTFEEVNHAVLHDLQRPIIKGQFYPEVYKLFSVYLRPIYCRRAVITLLCIRMYRPEEGLLSESRSFKWLPKEIIVLIAKYLYSTRYERCWDKK